MRASSPPGAAWRRALRDNAPFVLVVAAYVLAGSLALQAIGREIPYSFTEIYRGPALLTGLYVGMAVLLATAKDVILARRPAFDRDTWALVWRRWFGSRRIAGALIVLAALPALLDVMLGFRLALTEFRPFAYDLAFMRWDEWLHLGRHPWELLQPLLGHESITILLDRVYVYGWFAILWSVTIWQSVHGREPVRLQFLLSFSVSWILLGTIAAVALSSAGPVYFGRVTGLNDPYAPLFAYLASVDAETPLRAIANQERLWLTYRTWGGITAMPSMHLAITTVIALTAIRSHRGLGWIVGPFWMLMMLGSIHLGWHYAVDSYVGALGAAFIWYSCGKASRWWHAKAPYGPCQPSAASFTVAHNEEV